MNETDVISLSLELTFIREANRTCGCKGDVSVSMRYAKNTSWGANLLWGGGRGFRKAFLEKMKGVEI